MAISDEANVVRKRREMVTWHCDTCHLHSASNMSRRRYAVRIHTSPLITSHQVTRSSLQTNTH